MPNALCILGSFCPLTYPESKRTVSPSLSLAAVPAACVEKARRRKLPSLRPSGLLSSLFLRLAFAAFANAFRQSSALLRTLSLPALSLTF